MIIMGSESDVVMVFQSTLHWEHCTLLIFAFLLLLRTGSRAHTLVKAQARGGGRSQQSRMLMGGRCRGGKR
jgi:hypothetical protein